MHSQQGQQSRPGTKKARVGLQGKTNAASVREQQPERHIPSRAPSEASYKRDVAGCRQIKNEVVQNAEHRDNHLAGATEKQDPSHRPNGSAMAGSRDDPQIFGPEERGRKKLLRKELRKVYLELVERGEREKVTEDDIRSALERIGLYTTQDTAAQLWHVTRNMLSAPATELEETFGKGRTASFSAFALNSVPNPIVDTRTPSDASAASQQRTPSVRFDKDFSLAFMQLQTQLEQNQHKILRHLRGLRHDGDADLESQPRGVDLGSLRSVLVDLSVVPEGRILDSFLGALQRSSSSSGGGSFHSVNATSRQINAKNGSSGRPGRSDEVPLSVVQHALAGISNPADDAQRRQWQHLLAREFEWGRGRVAPGQRGLYREFLDTLWPSVEQHLGAMSFLQHDAAARQSLPTIPRKNAASSLFGGPAFAMPQLADSCATPQRVQRGGRAALGSLPSVDELAEPARSLSVPPMLGGPEPASVPPRPHSRAGSARSEVSSAWSRLSTGKLPSRQGVEQLIQADKARGWGEKERWHTVSVLENAEPGSGLAGEEERSKVEKERRENHIRHFEQQKRWAEGQVMELREKEESREEGKVRARQQFQGEIDRRLREQRGRRIGIGNTRVYTGHMDNQQVGNRDAQLLEGEVMDVKRERQRQREAERRSRAEGTLLKEAERQRKLEEREDRRRRRSEAFKQRDLDKEELKQEILQLKHRAQREFEDARKGKDGDNWSAAQALKAHGPRSVPRDAAEAPFALDSKAEDQRLEHVVRQRLRQEEAMEQTREHRDRRRPRLQKLLHDAPDAAS